MGRQKTTAAGEPLSIRLSEDLRNQCQLVADKLELSLHDTMRLLMKVGIEDMRRSNFDLASAIVDLAHKPKDEISLLAEEAEKYDTKKKSA